MTAPRESGARAGRIIGRYLLEEEIASGGMATVHLGRMTGGGGFARTVALKRLHPHIAKDPELRTMLLDEARIVARVHHTNVVQTLDLVTSGEEVLLVMEYVHGEALHRLARAAMKRGERIPPAFVVTIVAQALHGLHAAHEAKDELGHPLDVVHRDVSPQNILVGADGVARVLDFGVAKARGRLQSTQDGALKGKLSYMPPEQFRAAPVDRRADIYAASVVLWEMLVGRELYGGGNEAVTIARVLEGGAEPPSAHVPGVPASLDAIVLRGLAKDPAARFRTALEMAEALHRVTFATPGQIAAYVREMAGPSLDQRTALIQTIESRTRPSPDPPVVAPPLPRTTIPLLVTPPSAPPAASPSAPLAPIVGALAPSFDPSSPTAPLQMATAHTVRRARPTATWVRTKGALALIAIVSLSCVALIAWLVVDRGAPGEGTPATSAAPAPSPVSATVSAPMVEPRPAPTVEEPASPSATPTVSGSTSRPASSARPSKPRAPVGNCNPPYTVDADGIRTPKPECL